jgi:hypothetical protein
LDPGLLTLTVFGSLSDGSSFPTACVGTLFRSWTPVSNANGLLLRDGSSIRPPEAKIIYPIGIVALQFALFGWKNVFNGGRMERSDHEASAIQRGTLAKKFPPFLFCLLTFLSTLINMNH